MVNDPVSSLEQYGDMKHGMMMMMKAAAQGKNHHQHPPPPHHHHQHHHHHQRGGGEAQKAEQKVSVRPPWLEALLQAEFFQACAIHGEASKHERNQFCVDCMGPALCMSCVQAAHREHHVVQIRRSSYHDVVRVSEIQRALDLSGIQTYIINSARVVFIHGRPQARQGKGVTNNCDVCDRSLNDGFRFCSLGCKLEGIRTRHPEMSFLVPPALPHPKVAPGLGPSSDGDDCGGAAMKRPRSYRKPAGYGEASAAAADPNPDQEEQIRDRDQDRDQDQDQDQEQEQYQDQDRDRDRDQDHPSQQRQQRRRHQQQLQLQQQQQQQKQQAQPPQPQPQPQDAMMSPATPPLIAQQKRSAKRRKGTPHRAPMGV